MGPRCLLPYAQEPHLSPSSGRSIQSMQLPSSHFIVLVFCCVLINHFMWSLLVAPKPTLCSKYVILYSLLRFVKQYFISYSFICNSWQCTDLQTLNLYFESFVYLWIPKCMLFVMHFQPYFALPYWWPAWFWSKTTEIRSYNKIKNGHCVQQKVAIC
jgi:hypothetical protein